MSTYSADSILLTIFEGDWLHLTVTNDTIPLLTTTMLDGVFPGLVDQYGDE